MGVRNPSVPNPAHCEEGLTEFFEILSPSPLPAEEAMARKISIRRAWVFAKAYLKGPNPKRDDKANPAVSDSDDEAGPITRRGYLAEFRRRHRFSTPTHHQPSDKAVIVITRRLYLDVVCEDHANVRETCIHFRPVKRYCWRD